MKFTKLEKNFLENYNRNFDKSTKQDGISIMTDGKMFFIPITSPKKSTIILNHMTLNTTASLIVKIS